MKIVSKQLGYSEISFPQRVGVYIVVCFRFTDYLLFNYHLISSCLVNINTPTMTWRLFILTTVSRQHWTKGRRERFYDFSFFSPNNKVIQCVFWDHVFFFFAWINYDPELYIGLGIEKGVRLMKKTSWLARFYIWSNVRLQCSNMKTTIKWARLLTFNSPVNSIPMLSVLRFHVV